MSPEYLQLWAEYTAEITQHNQKLSREYDELLSEAERAYRDKLLAWESGGWIYRRMFERPELDGDRVLEYVHGHEPRERSVEGFYDWLVERRAEVKS